MNEPRKRKEREGERDREEIKSLQLVRMFCLKHQIADASTGVFRCAHLPILTKFLIGAFTTLRLKLNVI